MNCDGKEVVISIESTVAEIDYALKLLKANEGKHCLYFFINTC